MEKDIKSQQRRRTVRCPKCELTKTVPIWYGGILPDLDFEPHMAKKVELKQFYQAELDFDKDGEVIDSPAIRHCNKCEHNY